MFCFLRLFKGALGHEVGECLSFYKLSRPELQAVFTKLNTLFDHPTRCGHPLKYLFERLIYKHSDMMTLKVLP